MGASRSSGTQVVDSEEDAEWVKVELEDCTPHIHAAGDEDLLEDLTLDEEAFPCFAPLLSACQAYASHSGCRFRSSDFSDLPGKDSPQANTCEAPEDDVEEAAACHRLAARLHAAPMVACFADRLKDGELELVEEMSRAYDVVMSESVRNAMVAAFRELDLWPPVPAPAGIPEADCNFEDLSAPIPVIAQRAYNDEVRRRREDSNFGTIFRRATTASYLVDFIYETGVHWAVASSSDHHLSLLHLFGERVEQWEKAMNPVTVDTEHETGYDFAEGKAINVAGISVEEFGFEAARLWTECWREAFLAFTSSIFLSSISSAGTSLLRRSLRSTCSQEAKMIEHGVLVQESRQKLDRLEVAPVQEIGCFV